MEFKKSLQEKRRSNGKGVYSEFKLEEKRGMEIFIGLSNIIQ